jgi:hypothetical protein
MATPPTPAATQYVVWVYVPMDHAMVMAVSQNLRITASVLPRRRSLFTSRFMSHDFADAYISSHLPVSHVAVLEVEGHGEEK